MSHAMLPAQFVIDACNLFLIKRDARIEREKEEALARVVGKKLWFFEKPVTRERAKEICSEEFFVIDITGGAFAREVRELRDLAIIAQKLNKDVNVSASIASQLFSNFIT
jgi:hypothetical protein